MIQVTPSSRSVLYSSPRAAVPSFSIIIPYFDRSANLKRAVAGWIEQQTDSPYEVVVVSYSDDLLPVDASAAVRVVNVSRDRWNLARAYNIGALNSVGRVLCFTTADIVPAPKLLSGVAARYKSACAWRHVAGVLGYPTSIESSRIVFCKRWVFTRMRGFDEQMMESPPGWGYTFEDFTVRLGLCASSSGESVGVFAADDVAFLAHGDEERMLPYSSVTLDASYRAHREFSEDAIRKRGFCVRAEFAIGKI